MNQTGVKMPFKMAGVNRIILIPAQGGWIAQVKVHSKMEQNGLRKCTTRTVVRPNLQALFLAVEKEAEELGVNVDSEARVSAW